MNQFLQRLTEMPHDVTTLSARMTHIFRNVGVLQRWLADIREELSGPKGWKLFAEILAGILLLWGALLGIMTYHSAHLVELKDAAERSHHELLHDLEHDSARVRIEAIQRVPDIMLRQIPVSDYVGPLEALRLTLGGQRHTQAIYHASMQRAVKWHLASLNPKRKDWSLEEVQAIIDLLAELGAAGWYRGEVLSVHPNKSEGIQWVWMGNPDPGSIDATSLFESIRMDGVDLQQFSLNYADFRGASLRKANISFAHILHGDFSTAVLDDADLSNTDAHFSKFENASLERAYFTSSLLNSSSFKFSKLSHAHLQEAQCTECLFQNAVLDAAFAVNANMNKADLSFASLISADFEGANLTSASLSYTNARNAKFAYAHLQNAKFSNSDLRRADFSHCDGLLNVAAWNDANIWGATGITRDSRLKLIRAGAVEIAGDQQWEEYRRAGRPHKSWTGFQTRPGRKKK